MHKPSYTLQTCFYSQTRIFKLQSVIAQQKLNTRSPKVFIVKPFENLYSDLLVPRHEIAAEGDHL